MKYMKMIGFAAIAATALTASVGVGSASAVTLCEENVSTGCKSHVNLGTTIEFSAEDSNKVSGPFGITIATCTESTIKAATENTVADDLVSPVMATVTVLTFSNCNRTVTVEKAGKLSITASGSEGNGTVTSSGATWTIHEVPAPFPSTCSYVTENTDIGRLTHNATVATLDIEATIKSETPNCPDGTWSGHYVSTGTPIKAVAH